MDELGVHIIEAGSAIASEGEVAAIRSIVKEKLTAEICSFARALRRDVDAVVRSDAPSIHLVVPTSPMHIQYKLKRSPDEVVRMAVDAVQYAKDHGLTVEFSAEDATRSEMDFLKEVFAAGVQAGADRLCACDTVGVLTPERAQRFYAELSTAFPVPLSVHCHDDFGMAVANTLAGLLGGAREVHATVNGLGERAGNASLEEVVMSLQTLHQVALPLKTHLFYSTSRLVAKLTGFPVPANKAIVGANAFTHEAGIHTHAILASPSTYEPLAPEQVGVTRRFTAGKLSGVHGIQAFLQAMDLDPTPEQLHAVFNRVKALGDKGKVVSDVDLYTIAEAVMGLPPVRPLVLEEVTVMTGNKITPTAAVRINLDGAILTEAAVGIGPVDAAINAINKAVGRATDITLEEYQVKAITGGTDAVVEVSVRIKKDDRRISSLGAHGDIVMASVEAMLNGMNVLMARPNSNANSLNPQTLIMRDKEPDEHEYD